MREPGGPWSRDRAAVVTGAGPGIGAATAERPAREGARPQVADLDDTRGARVAARIGRLGGPARTAAAVVFLAFGDASCITGASLVVGRRLERGQGLGLT